MAHDYTPAEVFAETITLVDDGDLLDAASVNGPLSQLADRDQALKAMIEAVPALPDHIALKNAANTFSQPQTIAAESGLWDLQLVLGPSIRVYTSHNPGGGATGAGGFGIAYNAQWVSNHWARLDGGAPAYWLSMNFGNVYLTSVNQASWTAWPGFSAGSSTALGDLFIARHAHVGGELKANVVNGTTVKGKTVVAPTYNFETSTLRTTAIRIRTASGPVKFASNGSAFFDIDASATERARGIYWPLYPIVRSGLGSIDLRVHCEAGADRFCIVRRSNGFSGAPSETVITGTLKTATSGGDQTISGIVHASPDDDAEYYLRWQLQESGGGDGDQQGLGTNRVLGIRRKWVDSGLTNAAG